MRAKCVHVRVALGTLVEKRWLRRWWLIVLVSRWFTLVCAGLNWFPLVGVSGDTDIARKGIVGNSNLFNGPLEQGGRRRK